MNIKLLMMTVCLLIPADCTRIISPDNRLACFDRLFPANTRAADPKKDLRDITIDENAHFDKSLKICRDCSK